MEQRDLAIREFFGSPDIATWQELAQATLGKRPLGRLTRDLGGGVLAPPLATEADSVPLALPSARTPGETAIFTALYEQGPQDTLGPRIADDLEHEVTSLWLCGGRGLSARAEDLVSIPLPATELWLDDAITNVETLSDLAGKAGSTLGELRGGLRIDPIARLAETGRRDNDLWSASIAALSSVAEAGPGLRVIGVSSLPVHDAGGNAVDELAWLLAALAETLRALEDSGGAAGVLPRTTFTLGIGRDTPLAIAKVRAARRLLARITEACGVSETCPPLIHAVSSITTLTKRACWNNLLRGTLEGFAAVVGGADRISLRSFDSLLGTPGELGRRMARNTALLLFREARVAEVLDPAGGSYALEDLTDQLSEKAWQRFQEIEKAGGVIAALESGDIQNRVAETVAALERDSGKRKLSVVGVTDYALLEERQPDTGPAPSPEAEEAEEDREPALRPLAPWRAAAAHEALREDVERALAAKGDEAPRVLLLGLVSTARSKGRVGFTRRLFTTAGLSTTLVELAEDAPPPELARVGIVAFCGHDDDYAAAFERLMPAVRAAGVPVVVVAGRPGDAAEARSAAGITDHIYLGAELRDCLRDMLRRAGVLS